MVDHEPRVPFRHGVLDTLSEVLWWAPNNSEDPPLPPKTRGTKPAPDLTARVEASARKASLSSVGGAFAELRIEEAREEAREGARPNGRLADLLVGVKELVGIAGLQCRAGTLARSQRPREERDAWITAALRSCGAVIVGSTACHELAFGVTGINSAFGSPRNPADPTRVAGGSSSGSAAAVAESSVDLAIGTDTGGSIRIPSSFCGVVGFKPSYGTFSLNGVLALSPSLDHLGLHSRDVATVTRCFEALRGRPIRHRKPQRLGIAVDQLVNADPDVGDAVRQAIAKIETSGVEVLEIVLPDPEVVLATSTAIMWSEAAAVHRELLLTHRHLLGADVAERLDIGSRITAASYVAALEEQVRLCRQVDGVLSSVDALIGPTVPMTAPSIDEARAQPHIGTRIVAFTRLSNLTGSASITIPLPTSPLPIGLQITAARNGRLLGIAQHLERIVGTSVR